MIAIRCSELPRIMSCPASLDIGEIEIRSGGKNAGIGTAVHEVIADIIRAGDFQMPDLFPHAERNGCEVDEISFLCWRGLKLWKQYAPNLRPNVSAEYECGIRLDGDQRENHVILSGHVDVKAETMEGQGVIIDWKTSGDKGFYDQLTGYALLCFRGNPLGAKIVTANLRENVTDIIELTDEAIYQFGEKIVETASLEKKPFNPTAGNCQYCPRRADCPAMQAMARNATRLFTPVASNSTLPTRENLASLYDQSKVLERTLDQYKEALKSTISEGGDLTLPDGRVVTLETSKRQTVTAGHDFFEAAAFALDVVANDEVITKIGESAFSVKKSDAIKAVRATAPRGEKDGAERKFMEELEHVGCLKTTEFEKIVCRKA